ncbi:hypothetical protein N7488_002781 [Penicillium malachiteum]|nr:hypothetical protein N7488_002781 [Penicillium malachiteum]
MTNITKFQILTAIQDLQARDKPIFTQIVASNIEDIRLDHISATQGRSVLELYTKYGQIDCQYE